MNFLNKYIIRFAIIAIILSVVFFLSLNHFITIENGTLIMVASISYAAGMFINGLVNGKKDIYEGHYGYNYHLVTYIISCSVPMLMALLGVIHKEFINTAIQMYMYWGITVAIHTVVYLVLRKRAIKGFDKGEIFD